jgi:hypothetical protein
MEPANMKANLMGAAVLHSRFKRGDETAHYGRMYYELGSLYTQFAAHCELKNLDIRQVLGSDVDSLYAEVVSRRAAGQHRADEPDTRRFADKKTKPRRGVLTGEDNALVKDVFAAHKALDRRAKAAPTKGDKLKNKEAARAARAADPNTFKYNS